MVLIISISGLSKDTTSDVSSKDCPGYTQKLIFGETPEIPHAWHFSFRNMDIFYNELFLCIKDWFSIGLEGVALPLKPSTDKYSTFTIKSPCLRLKIKNEDDYKLGGGIKFFGAELIGVAEDEENPGAGPDTILNIQEKSSALFVTQSYKYKRHYFNLSSSIFFTEQGVEGEKTIRKTITMRTGYKFSLNSRWDFVFEYLWSNMMFMPINPLFENWEQKWIDYIFYGARYTRKYFFLELMLASHYTFAPMEKPYPPLRVQPLISLGFKL
jgi:hypothetical protein